jgi:acetylaranotin biosynthesis cluster protein L
VIEYSTPKITANPAGQDVRLSREQIWRAFEWKAEFPTLFVKPIKQARVLETFDDGILREIVHEDPGAEPEVLHERVFYEPMERMTFLRLNGRVLGQIINAIEEGEYGELTVRFMFTLAIDGAEHGGARERAYQEQFADGYVFAVGQLLEMTREAVRTGVDPTAELAAARATGVTA